MSRSRPQAFRELAALAGVSVAVLVGAGVGQRYANFFSSLGRVAPADQIEVQIRQFESALDAVSHNYASPVDRSEAVFDGAIPGMLERLDPHSQFFDARDFERLREEQQGSYAGVGMQIRLFRGQPIVDHPFPSTPAYRAGVQPGDAILSVDGQPTDDRTVEEVADLVRGVRGTSVHLELTREGLERQLEVDLVRDSIPRPTVPLAFRLPGDVGYVQVTSFGEATPDEFDAALDRLRHKDLQGLLLDLRGNHGGLLRAGVHIAGRFLPNGSLIVSHRGRASRERRYVSRTRGDAPAYPLIVLADCRSASASEIVAGALQDHDRALVAGSNTFGKGLVQSVLQLPQSSGMVLTTARYYTPSGRLIQRPYNEMSINAYYADPCAADYEPHHEDVKLTDAGRPVYGGAGIAPDIALAPLEYDELTQWMLNARAFERFAHRLTLEPDAIPRDWDLDRSVFDRFQAFVREERIDVDPAAFEDRWSFIRRQLKKAVFTAAFDIDQGERVSAELDPAVRQALALLPEAEALLTDAKEGRLARSRREIDSASP